MNTAVTARHVSSSSTNGANDQERSALLRWLEEKPPVEVQRVKTRAAQSRRGGRRQPCARRRIGRRVGRRVGRCQVVQLVRRRAQALSLTLLDGCIPLAQKGVHCDNCQRASPPNCLMWTTRIFDSRWWSRRRSLGPTSASSLKPTTRRSIRPASAARCPSGPTVAGGRPARPVAGRARAASLRDRGASRGGGVESSSVGSDADKCSPSLNLDSD